MSSKGMFDVFAVFIISIMIVEAFDIHQYVNSLIGVISILFIASVIWIIAKNMLIDKRVEL